MKFHHLILFLLFYLAACAPSTSAPTARPVPTSTLTPIPTATQTASPTPEAWVAIAEEYGMPQDQAQKLEGLNISFERITEHVDGVLVKENGVDVFFYSEKYDFLVACDKFDGVEEMSDSTGRSVEMSAWLYYKALNYDFNLEGYRASLAQLIAEKIESGKMTAEEAAEIKNFPMMYYNTGGVPYVGLDHESIPVPTDGGLLFVKDMGVFIEITDVNSKYYDKNIFTSIALLDLETGKVIIAKGIIQGGENNIAGIIDKWKNEMKVPFVITWLPEDIDDSEPTLRKTEEMAGKESGTSLKDRVSKYSKNGDPTALDDPNLIFEFMSW